MTTATVSTSSSRATSAMTGEAPVPVPPPIPGGDEEHVGSVEDLGNAVAVLERRGAAELGVRPRSEIPS